MADICGPFTLEQMDAFGTLEEIQYSFDDPVWLTACIYDAVISNSISSNVNAQAEMAYSSSAIANVQLALTTDFFIERNSYASASITSDVSATGMMYLQPTINLASAVNYGLDHVIFFAADGEANVTMSANADGSIQGDIWTDKTNDSEVWHKQ